MYRFVTYFDHNYLSRGLALYRSLDRLGLDFRLSVIALSPECQRLLDRLALPRLDLIPLGAVEAAYPELPAVRPTRSTVEYYFTLTPVALAYVLRSTPAGAVAAYVDSDLYFFADPAPVYQEMDGHSVGIIGHRFPAHLRHQEARGRYNVGWMGFRNDADGLACLDWYKARCLEWCHDRVEPERYADQKYLDYFAERFDGVADIRHKGANLAPWNVANYAITERGNGVRVDDDRLIFYHFQGFKRVLGDYYDTALGLYGARPTPVIMEGIYRPYLDALAGVNADLADLAGLAGLAAGDSPVLATGIRAVHDSGRSSLGRKLRQGVEALKKLRRLTRMFLAGAWIKARPARTRRSA